MSFIEKFQIFVKKKFNFVYNILHNIMQNIFMIFTYLLYEIQNAFYVQLSTSTSKTLSIQRTKDYVLLLTLLLFNLYPQPEDATAYLFIIFILYRKRATLNTKFAKLAACGCLFCIHIFPRKDTRPCISHGTASTLYCATRHIDEYLSWQLTSYIILTTLSVRGPIKLKRN